MNKMDKFSGIMTKKFSLAEYQKGKGVSFLDNKYTTDKSNHRTELCGRQRPPMHNIALFSLVLLEIKPPN